MRSRLSPRPTETPNPLMGTWKKRAIRSPTAAGRRGADSETAHEPPTTCATVSGSNGPARGRWRAPSPDKGSSPQRLADNAWP
jgi:hypothetical protein